MTFLECLENEDVVLNNSGTTISKIEAAFRHHVRFFVFVFQDLQVGFYAFSPQILVKLIENLSC